MNKNMFNLVKVEEKMVDGKMVDLGVFENCIEPNFIIKCGTNGECGGDYGHGSRTAIKFEHYIDNASFEIGGDWELDLLIDGLRCCADYLEETKIKIGVENLSSELFDAINKKDTKSINYLIPELMVYGRKYNLLNELNFETLEF